MSENNNALKLKVQSQAIPVFLEGPDGKEKEYAIVEMSSAARDQYLDTMKARLDMTEKGIQRIKKYEGLRSDLLERSFREKKGEEFVPVNRSFVDKLPSSVAQALFEASQKLNSLVEEGPGSPKEGAEQAKND